ncbi:hypothetical protein CH643_27500, partial [Salmonella enterica subsp. enterica serovar Typhimurium]|uniref:hypothetical protein n=1 Tax=Salmonella enterica TaxID=28901 RepID=UPI000BC94FDB
LGDNMGTGMAVDKVLRTQEITYIWPHAGEEQGSGGEKEGAGEAKGRPGGTRGFSPGTTGGGGGRELCVPGCSV